MLKRIVLLCCCYLLVPILSRAQVVNPWVVAAGQLDTRDLSRLTESLFARDSAVTPRQQALSIWNLLLTDGRFVPPGMFYHLGGWAYEEPEGEVLDPLKLINSYGCGLCYQVAPLLEALYDAAGFTEARCWFLTGHTVAEVFFDGRYNMLDADMLGFSTLGEEDPRTAPISAVLDLERDQRIILGKLLAPDRIDSAKVVLPWYPADVRAKAMDGYAGAFASRADNWLFPGQRYGAGHSMDFTLRPGERLVRFFEPEDEGLFYLPYMLVEGQWRQFSEMMAQWKPDTWQGPHSQKDARRWATGRQEWRPRLDRRDSYYPLWGEGFNHHLELPSQADGALGCDGEARTASAVFEMPGAYVLIDAEVALYAELSTPAHRLTVATSTDGGRSWVNAASLTGPHAGPWRTRAAVLDQTGHGVRSAVSGRYGYLVRLTLSGPGAAGQARLRDLQLTSLFQLNPRTLPALGRGPNTLVYRPGPPARRWELPVDLGRLRRFAYRVSGVHAVTEQSNLLLTPIDRGRDGELLFELAAPDSSELSEFNAGGRFLVIEGHAPEKRTAETRRTTLALGGDPGGSLAWALSPEGPFTEIWRYDPRLDWADGRPVDRLLRWPEVDRRVAGLPPGTRRVYLRYRLRDMALDKLRLAVYTPAPAQQSPLELTHLWRRDGAHHRQTIELADPAREQRYTIDTGRWGEIVNEAVILACPPGD